MGTTFIPGSVLAPGASAATAGMQIDIKARIKALREQNTEKWSTDGLTVVLVISAFVAAVAIGWAVAAGRRKKERERRRRAATPRPKPQAPPAGAVRYELREGEPQPAEALPRRKLDGLRPGSAVVVMGSDPGSEVHEGRVVEQEGDTLRFSLSSGARPASELLYLVKRRFDAAMTVFPLVLLKEEDAAAHGNLAAVLDEEKPILRLHAGGIVPVRLQGVLFLADEGDDDGGEEGAPVVATVVTGLGLSRLQLGGDENLPADQEMTLRVVPPGEDASVELRVRRRDGRKDPLGRPVAELSVVGADVRDLALLARCVADFTHRGLAEAPVPAAG